MYRDHFHDMVRKGANEHHKATRLQWIWKSNQDNEIKDWIEYVGEKNNNTESLVLALPKKTDNLRIKCNIDCFFMQHVKIILLILKLSMLPR